MILLQRDCLVFENANGEKVPRSALDMAIELLGKDLNQLDEEFLQSATEAVVHYFRTELAKTTVTATEFAEALARVLRGFGWEAEVIESPKDAPASASVPETDLRRLAGESGPGFELEFFQRMRETLRRQLAQAPELVRFSGLRGCVKQLTGARRWSPRCQRLNDQIVEYLRSCLSSDSHGRRCTLIVQ